MSEITHPATPPATPPSPNRRAARRHRVKGSTKPYCYPNALGLGRNMALAVLDVSETGVRLLVKNALQPGQEVEVGLEGIGHGRPVRLPGRVVWSVATADGNHCVGVQFDRVIRYADLHQLANL